MDLKNRTAIVTGGAMGIGKACVRALREAGANVIVADINEAEGKKTAEEFGCHFVRCNISSEEDAADVREEALRVYGSVDILVNNAALQTVSDFDHTTVSDFRRVIDVNLGGTFNMISAMTKVMKEGSTILNMLSVHYEQPRLDKFGYDASKAGLAMLTREAALALSTRGITVNGISYGAVKTPMNAEMLESEDAVEKARKNIPLGWVAEADEIGDYVKVILETFSDHATGSVFTIDGGRRLK